MNKHNVELTDAERSAIGDELEGNRFAAAPEPTKTTLADPEDAKPDEDAAAKAAKDASAVAAAAQESTDADKGAGADKNVMIPKARFDEVNDKLKDMRARMEQIEAERAHAASVATTTRDFKAEKSALQTQYDDGVLELSEYMEKREAIVVDEAKFAARSEQAAANAENAKAAAQQAWDAKVNAWSTAHADFLANQFRRDAVASLFDKIGAANPNMSDDALLAEVQKQAFEAFNYTPSGAAVAAAAAVKNPHAVRDRNDATMQAHASSVPSPASGGTGNRGHDVKGDAKDMSYEEFKSLTPKQQAALLGEDY